MPDSSIMLALCELPGITVNELLSGGKGRYGKVYENVIKKAVYHGHSFRSVL